METVHKCIGSEKVSNNKRAIAFFRLKRCSAINFILKLFQNFTLFKQNLSFLNLMFLN